MYDPCKSNNRNIIGLVGINNFVSRKENEKIIGFIKIDGLLAGGCEGSNAWLLNNLKTIGFARPVHAVAFLADIYRFTQRQFEPLKVNLLAFRENFREKFF